ncbi:MAG: hypothetical protein GWP08_06020 [Nitrospiraceae bacterium]|nr:hypothetical protein [Nitrospiraceae bacterium]
MYRPLDARPGVGRTLLIVALGVSGVRQEMHHARRLDRNEVRARAHGVHKLGTRVAFAKTVGSKRP